MGNTQWNENNKTGELDDKSEMVRCTVGKMQKATFCWKVS
jgi:hypothetical protein